MTVTSTQIQLVNRPTGWPEPKDFSTVTVEYGDLAAGQVRVANEFISVDPYMRGRMIDTRSYIPPFQLDETMTGGAVGRVVATTVDDLPVGTLVSHMLGWRDVTQADAGEFRALPEPPTGAASSIYLGVLGMTGLTAYVGLLTIASMQPGDTVFISGAAGAVGTAAAQIARLKGAHRVIGSAGSAEKVALLTDRYGYDAAFNYKDGPVRRQLRDAAPDGIDVYFDNVGGDHLEAALDSFNDGGRAALCGAIAQYNATSRTPGPSNMANIITRGLTLRGFTIGNHFDQAGKFNREMSGWFADGKIVHDETVVTGIDNAVDAFLGLMRGENTGKMVVRTS
jgi:NADPH-dependent curcumin reductase CurA